MDWITMVGWVPMAITLPRSDGENSLPTFCYDGKFICFTHSDLRFESFITC